MMTFLLIAVVIIGSLSIAVTYYDWRHNKDDDDDDDDGDDVYDNIRIWEKMFGVKLNLEAGGRLLQKYLRISCAIGFFIGFLVGLAVGIWVD